VEEMLETWIAFEPQGTLTKVASCRLTQQEIESIGVLPGSRVEAV
jgi:hypothetical protein